MVFVSRVGIGCSLRRFYYARQYQSDKHPRVVAVGQCDIAPPVNQDPSIEYSLYGAVGLALSARYPVSATR